MTDLAQPYLSVVVTARNDDHGGNLLGRMQAFVNGLLNQCARHQLPAELVIVEWNPLPDRPSLASALNWHAANRFCDVRVIEVPHDLHRRFEHWRTLPLYQMIAKNVGIRRSRGEFVLATNIDILFSDELMSFIAARKLELQKMYRIDRWDIQSDVPVDASVEDQLAYCETHLIRVNAREGTYRVSADGVRILEANDIAVPDGGIRLGANWFPREMSGTEPFRWVENNAELIIDPKGSESVLVLDVEPGPGVNMGAFSLDLHDVAGALAGSVSVKRRTIVTFPLRRNGSDPLRVSLHTEQGGTKISSDPRTLNFRVFRCGLETESGVARLLTEPAQTRAARSWTSRAGRGLRLLREFCTSAVQIRVPMSPTSLDRLALRQDGGGVSFFVGPLTGLFRRRRDSFRGGVLGPGLGALWGDGWYPVEHFRGEPFRWMRRQGALVLVLPPAPVSQISLIVESGPAVGFAPVSLEIQDQWGGVLAKAAIDGRTRVNVPISQAECAVSLSLIVHGGGAPKELEGDSRTMALRLLRCEGEGESFAHAPSVEPWETRTRSGIWCSRGWTQSGRGEAGISAVNSAEIILRTPDEAPSTLTLGIEIPKAHSDDAHGDLVIKDSSDRELFRGHVEGHQEIAIPGTYPPSTYCVLRFEIEGGPAPQETRHFTLMTVSWRTGDAPPTQMTIRVDRGEDLATHLHTNACGDFTLVAREHWTDLRGYAELDAFSMNIDSLFCWTAHHGGAREEFLDSPMRIFHIEHATGSGWTPEGQDKLYERIAAKGIPWLSYDDVVQWARAMNRLDVPMIFNHEDWGLALEALREIRPVGRERAGAP